MKIVTLSDLHLIITNPQSRKDNLVETQFEKLIFVLDYVRKNDAILVLPGDIFDTPRSWYLLPKIAELLQGLRVLCVYGQHDTYYYNVTTRHATILGVLDKAGLVTILGGVPLVVGDIAFYGASITEPVPEIEDINQMNVLVTHAPISDTALYSTQEYINAEKFLDSLDFNLILCGDIHRKFIIQKENNIILNSGPLLRIESTEYNMKHKPGVWAIDTETRKVEFIEVPHKPSEEVLTRHHIVTPQEIKETMNDFISILHKKGDAKSEKKNLKDKIIEYFGHHEIEEPVRELFSQLIHKG